MGNKRSVFLILVMFLSCALSEASSSRRVTSKDNTNKYNFSTPDNDASNPKKNIKNNGVGSSVTGDLEALRARRSPSSRSKKPEPVRGLNIPRSASNSKSPVADYGDWMPELNKDPTQESIARLKKQEKEKEELVNKLLKLNYNIHTPPRQLHDISNNGENKSSPPIYLKSEYFDMAFVAVEKDNQDALRGFLSTHNFLNKQNEDGDTLLIRAIQSHSMNTARILLARKALVDIANNRKRTALHYASALGDVNSIKLLLSMGANPYLKDDMDMMALDYAILNQQYQAESVINKYLESK